MAWDKGQTGNPLGGALRKPFKTAMIMELLKEGTEMPRLRRIADAVMTKAEDGDVQAVRFVAEWLDGRAIQTIDATINDRRDLSNLSDDEINRRIEELKQRRGRAVTITAEPAAKTGRSVARVSK
jgi:hypothetical protein